MPPCVCRPITAEETFLVHPGVFVVASKLAYGECVNLAIPALTIVCRELNRISMARNLTKLEAIFPTHYVYGWLGTYFKTHFEHPYYRNSLPKMVRISGEKMNRTPDVPEARELLRCKHPSVMYSNTLTKDTPMKLINSHSLSLSWRAYLIRLRSGFLTLRQARTIVMEPYLPCKFGLQFGFY